MKKELKKQSREKTQGIEDSLKPSKNGLIIVSILSAIALIIVLAVIGKQAKWFERDPIMKFPSMEGRDSHQFEVLNDKDDFLNRLNNFEDGVYMLSKQSCVFCSKAMPILDDAAADNNMKVIYLDANKIKGDEEYTKKLNEFEKNIPDEIEFESGILPLMFAIKDGKIKNAYTALPDGLGIVDLNKPLTGESRIALYKIYDEMFKGMK